MAFDFPASPIQNQLFSDPVSGAQYVFQNGAWMQVSAAQLKPTAQARSRVVNGAMQISQENGNTASSASGAYAADEWYFFYAAGSGVTFQRVQVVTPNGSQNRVRVAITIADTSLTTTEQLGVGNKIEGIRVADFRWGTASARQAILRFGFKAPAGTYVLNLSNSALNRSYIAQFTISAGQANTDTEQIIIIPGDTAGTWATDTTTGVIIRFMFGVGPTYQGTVGWQTGDFRGTSATSNGMATAGNVFELFDVGLYLDDQATGVPPPWVMPDEAQELAACQRYFTKLVGFLVSGYQAAGGVTFGNAPLSPNMRIAAAGSVANITYANASAFAPNSASTSDLQMKITMTVAGAGWGIGDITLNARM